MPSPDQPTLSLPQICASAIATYSNVEASGPAARPLDFPSPIVHRGRRVSVKGLDCYTGEIRKINNVIVRERDFSGKSSTANATDTESVGYHIVKKLSESAYGSIRLCVIMKQRHVYHCAKTQLASTRRVEGGDSLGMIHEEDHFSCENTSHRLTVEGDVVWEPTNEYVAVKIMSWSRIHNYRGRHLEDPIKEIAALHLTGNSSPYVNSTIEVIQDDNYLYSVMPYCNGGDLYTLAMNEVATREGRIDESHARHWFVQILHALSHLQKKGVCHRDLSLENILVHDGNVKIIDFGMALRVPHVDERNCDLSTDASAGTLRRLITAQGQGGRWTYMSPEIAQSDTEFDGYAVDLWAAGVILYLLLVGRAPWEVPLDQDIHFRNFSTGGLKETLRHWGIPISDDACDLLQSMFWRDPKRRLTLAQVIEHPWTRAGSSTEEELQSMKDVGHCFEARDDEEKAAAAPAGHRLLSLRNKKKRTAMKKK